MALTSLATPAPLQSLCSAEDTGQGREPVPACACASAHRRVCQPSQGRKPPGLQEQQADAPGHANADPECSDCCPFFLTLTCLTGSTQQRHEKTIRGYRAVPGLPNVGAFSEGHSSGLSQLTKDTNPAEVMGFFREVTLLALIVKPTNTA